MSPLHGAYRKKTEPSSAELVASACTNARRDSPSSKHFARARCTSGSWISLPRARTRVSKSATTSAQRHVGDHHDDLVDAAWPVRHRAARQCRVWRERLDGEHVVEPRVTLDEWNRSQCCEQRPAAQRTRDDLRTSFLRWQRGGAACPVNEYVEARMALWRGEPGAHERVNRLDAAPDAAEP